MDAPADIARCEPHGAGVSSDATAQAPLRAATARFMVGHPARIVALGFGSGLVPKAPGTAGTLAAWLAFLVLDRWLSPAAWGLVIAGGIRDRHPRLHPLRARHGRGRPVVDRLGRSGRLLARALARDAGGLAGAARGLRALPLLRRRQARPGGWADARFKLARGEAIGWRQGFGILFDDLVAALCALLVLALARTGPLVMGRRHGPHRA